LILCFLEIDIDLKETVETFFSSLDRKDAARQRRKMQERSAAEVRAIEEERAQQSLGGIENIENNQFRNSPDHQCIPLLS